MFILLEDDFDISTKALVSSEDGYAMRRKYQLDNLDKTATVVVTVVFPHYIWDISVSFFRALFLYSYKSLGEETFKKKFVFDTEPHLKSAIQNCLTDLKSYTQPPTPDESVAIDSWY
jgi:hypothetical protein